MRRAASDADEPEGELGVGRDGDDGDGTTADEVCAPARTVTCTRI